VVTNQPQLSTELSTENVDSRAAAKSSATAPASDAAILKVVIDAPLRQAFDYLPPQGTSASAVAVGARVRVPIGRQQTVGWVIGHAACSDLEPAALKRAHELLDPNSVLDEGVMRLLRWATDYYHPAPGELIAAAVPRAVREGRPIDPEERYWMASTAGREALAQPQRPRAPRQVALLERLAATPQGLSSGQLDATLPRWRSAARALHARGWAECYLRSAVQAPDARDQASEPAGRAQRHLTVAPVDGDTAAPALSAAQAAAVERIDASATSYGAIVLRGATGSGKTEVYLQCAQHALARGRSVLMLVPEIALTAQLIERVQQRLPVRLSVLHSALTDAERLLAWRAARSGEARVVLGTRSAVFAPVPQLGLIVVDEEHDSSYKQQEGGCRYSARDLAVVRAQQAGVPVVLGSATPALETLLNVQTQRYSELRLPRREHQAAAPLLKLIDLRAHAPRQGLSLPVIEAMRRHLSAGGQALVFINRRGYAPTLLCTACGWLATCAHCDARLTLHRARAQLVCHHCGATQPLPERCVRCGHQVKPVGQGTERVESTLQELFPDYALLRLDRDTASSPAQLDSIIGRIRRGEAHILVGTQMITKGHHFPSVLLVVVLNADQGLFSTDFRAAERLAQTIIQVAGRAGREQAQGEVLLQTEYPEHPLLQALLSGGYDAFAADALLERQAARWPPFGRLAMLRASSVAPDGALRFLAAARAAAPQAPAVQILGPVAAALARRADRYYAQLLIESETRAPLHGLIDAWLPAIEALARSQRVRYALDIDPIDIG
jgi:primosomal protein N' (replication factor Y) (superfamily II helicase)